MAEPRESEPYTGREISPAQGNTGNKEVLSVRKIELLRFDGLVAGPRAKGRTAIESSTVSAMAVYRATLTTCDPAITE